MRPNPLRDAIVSGDVALGAWLSTTSTANAELMGGTGFSYVCVDLQHGLIDYSDVVPLLQAVAIGTATPVVRAVANDGPSIGKMMDAGAMAVIVPMVNTREQCEAAVAAGRYAPKGTRSYGPTRVGLSEGADYVSRANTETMIIPMIETVEAIENVDDILSVEGVEAIYVGPADLAISLGLTPGQPDDRLHDALATVVEACERHGVVPGIHGNAAICADRIERGFRMITVSSDFVALRRAVAEDFAQAKNTVADANDSLY